MSEPILEPAVRMVGGTSSSTVPEDVAKEGTLQQVRDKNAFPLPQAQVDALKPPASVEVANLPAAYPLPSAQVSALTPPSSVSAAVSNFPATFPLPQAQVDAIAASGGGSGGGAVDQGAPGTAPWLTRPVAFPSYYVVADAVSFAANKHHISIFNAVGSGRVVKVRKLFAVNLQTAAITGVVTRFNVSRTTAQLGGTALLPTTMDSTNPLLTGITVASGATITEAALLFPWLTTTEEIPATSPLNIAAFQQMNNLILESPEVQEPTLRPGEGLTVKQVTSNTAGSYAWLMAFTVE